MHLMQHYLNNNHHIYTDRHYTSIPLTQSLASHNTFTGTVRWPKRKLSLIFGDPFLRDEAIIAEKCVSWSSALVAIDKSPVYSLFQEMKLPVHAYRTWVVRGVYQRKSHNSCCSKYSITMLAQLVLSAFTPYIVTNSKLILCIIPLIAMMIPKTWVILVLS